MPGKTSTLLHSDGSEGELQVVMDDQELLAIYGEEVCTGTHSLAALVHEGLWLEQSVLAFCCYKGVEFLRPLYRRVEMVTTEPTYIMPSFFIHFSRVAEEDEKFYHRPIIG